MNTLTALADPTRRQIVEILCRGEQAAGDIGRHFPVSAPAISQHLKVLREAGLVRVRGDAQRRIYALDPGGFDEIEDWIRRMRRFWNDRLDALERELEKEKAAERSPTRQRSKP